ncbi:MAG TPA: hypothetical protein VHR65_05270 [Solirubrobacterales bacterium]|jgi:hypothetical protein|nr:hypothetical protein [Solirubrobacterales bacterium]
MTRPLDIDSCSPEWHERVIDDALREGRITTLSAPEWRRRLDRDPEATERTLFSLAAVPSVGEANVREMGG